MFMRIDKLLTDIPMPKGQDPNAGSALQELLGGKYGENVDPQQLYVPELQFP